MNVLLPVSRFIVEFEVAGGRPYSVLERLVLKAVDQGAGNVEVLHKAFRVPSRLLIEALVTLTQAGWLAVGGKREGPGFVLTAEGEAALRSGVEPRSSLIVETKPPAYVVMESLTGALTLNSDIFLLFESRSRTKPSPGWDKALKLRPQVFRQQLDQSEVQNLLPRGRGEWVRSIGSITMESRDRYFAPISVDIDKGSVLGFPEAWRYRLQPVVLS